MNKNLTLVIIIYFVLFFRIDSKAQSCHNCTSTDAINSGLVFCTTMTGNANDGTASPVTPTITGTVVATTDRYTISNSAYDFTNSSTSKITYPASSKLSVPSNQSFSISTWFYARNTHQWGSYLAILSSSNQSSFSLLIGGTANGAYDGKLIFNDIDVSTSKLLVASPSAVTLNTWHHVVVTIDKTTNRNKVYYDDALIIDTTVINSLITNGSLYLGNNTVNAWGLNGKMDDVRIYNRALNNAEVSLLFSSKIPGLTPLPNQNICKGDSIQLNPAAGSFPAAYSWSPSTSLNNFSLANPKAKPLVTTKYYVSMQSGGCSAQDSVTIHVDSIKLTVSDKNVCLGDSLTFDASGATSYLWTPATGLSNPNIANPKVTPLKTTFYTVKGTSGACIAYDTAIISVCVCSQNTTYDTVRVTLRDTITYRDTIYTSLYDTTHIALFDTLHITLTDTVRITLRDTLLTTVTDTIHKTITDTVHVVIRDTIPIGVTDTLYINIIKTGLNLPNNVLNTVKIFPNPATDEIIIDNGNYLQTPNYSVKILNSLGQVVFNNTINRQEFRIPTNTLGSTGTYFVQILDQNNNVVETRKIVLR